MGKFAKQALVAFAVAVVFVTLGPGALTIMGHSFGTMASIAIITGAQLTLGAVSKALSPKQKLTAAENRVQLRGSLNSRKILYGRVASGGNMVNAHSYGTNKQNLSMVSMHGVGECDGVESLHVGDQTVSFSGNDAIGNYDGFLKMWFYPGTETQVADATLVGKGGWTADHRGDDVCYTHIQAVFDKEVWPRGLPAMFGVFRGRKLYDPRLDSTVPGGSGSHRFGDRTTWAYSVNPALAYLNYKTDMLYGCAVPLTRMDVPAIIAAANICDEQITHKDASTGNRYEIHGAIDTGARKADNIAAILSAMGGVEVYTGGKFSVHAAAWDTPTVTLTEDDLRGAIVVTTKVSRSERRNAVRGVYIDGDNLAVTDFPPRVNATWETEDGGERLWQDLELGWTADHRMAQRLAKIDVERSRREITVQWPGKLLGYQLKAWDTVKVTNSRFGWTDKTFRIIEWSLAEDGGVDMVLREEDAAVYAWTASSDEIDQGARSSVSVRAATDAISPAGLALVATSTTGVGGESIPAISVAWTASADPFIERMIIEYRKTADAEWQRLEGANPAAASALILGVASGTGYTVRINFRTTTGIFGTWQTNTVTTAAGYVAGDVVKVNGQPAATVQGDSLLGGNLTRSNGTLLHRSSLDGVDHDIGPGSYIDQGNAVLRPVTRGVAHGSKNDADAVSYSTSWSSGDLPIVKFGGGGITFSPSMSVRHGPVYAALNPSVTGFTVKARLREVTGAQTVVTDGPKNSAAWELHKSASLEAYDDNYEFKFNWAVGNTWNSELSKYVGGTATIEIWVNDGGGYTQVGSVTEHGGINPGGATTAKTSTITVSVDGVGIIGGTEFKIVIASGATAGTVISQFTHVKYTTVAAVVEETATPTGSSPVDFDVKGGSEIL